MSLETPEQPQLSQEQKEKALRESKIFKMRVAIQMELVRIIEHKLDDDAWRHFHADHSDADFEIAFDKALSNHPDLLEIYEADKGRAVGLVKESFEQVHQHHA